MAASALAAGIAADTAPDYRGLAGLTGVILAGGASLRMGTNKAVLGYRGAPLIQVIYRRMSELFAEVIIVTNCPEQYPFLPCRKVKDIYPGRGPLAGIHAGIVHSTTTHALVVACDMPWINPLLMQAMALRRDGFDVVVAEGKKGIEPLQAIYGTACVPAIEEVLSAGSGKITSFFPKVRMKKLSRQETSQIDPLFHSFRNINTPTDYLSLCSSAFRRDP